MSEALINPDILSWAMERASYSQEEIAEKMKVKPEKIMAWLSGEARPTFKQAQKFAKIVHVAFGYLFLSEPPEETLSIPDLRTVSDQKQQSVSVDLKDILYDIRGKHEWYLDYLKEQESGSLDFLEKFNITSPVPDIVRNMNEVLQITDELRQGARNYEQWLAVLSKQAEQAGILVMKSGIVGNNTRRKLNIEEFRGFAISNTYAPLIFINAADAKAAQIFTFAHELSHLWIGESGLSDFSLRNSLNHEHKKIEKFCNQVASEFLVPKSLFHEYWNENESLENNYENLIAKFRVSSVVIARRAFDLGKIDKEEFKKFYINQVKKWELKKSKSSGGGNFYTTTRVRNGQIFSAAVVSNALSGRLLFRDAGQLLGVKPGKIKIFAKELKGK